MNGQTEATGPSQRGRRDGLVRRDLILSCALRLFSTLGFEKTSIRAIARASRSNLASIYYHFGDKARLYETAIQETLAQSHRPHVPFDAPGLELGEAIDAYFDERLSSLAETEEYRMALRLREREDSRRPGSTDVERLLTVLKRHHRKSDEDQVLWLLAVAIGGMAAQLPTQIQGDVGVDAGLLRRWSASLSGFALSMMPEAEPV